MTDENTSKKGGFHIGTVGGNVGITAGGDIVGGDKTTTTTIQKGFAAEEQKQEFQAQIDQLREALRAVREEISVVGDAYGVLASRWAFVLLATLGSCLAFRSFVATSRTASPS